MVATVVIGVLIAGGVFAGAFLLQVPPPMLYVLPIGLGALWVLARIIRTSRSGSNSNRPE